MKGDSPYDIKTVFFMILNEEIISNMDIRGGILFERY